MELKYLVLLSALGVAAALTVPPQDQTPPPPSQVALETSFQNEYQDSHPSSELARDKRGLLYKKQGQGVSDTVYVNRRRYENAGEVAYVPGPEVNHHHSYNGPSYQPYPVYHGYQPGQGYYYGGPAQQTYYGNGGYVAPATPLIQQEETPINAAPLSSGQNTVERGQGAAAVNNIAIIHARAGSFTHNLGGLEGPLPVFVR